MRSRSQKAAVNIAFGFASEIVTLVCGLILPRLILSHFGSAYNGLTSSITQFMSCISLLTAGVGGVTRAALYKPLVQKDFDVINSIIGETEKFLRKVCLIFFIIILIFAAIYPIWISTEFDWFFSASMILIVSLSTFSQYFFGLTYNCLLEADQKSYIEIIFAICMVIANCLIASILIVSGCSIHIVKLGSAAVYVAGPIVKCIYVRRRYNIKKTTTQSNHLTQKWDALGHEIAAFINNNTDVMLLTVFTTLTTVSIYTVYHSIIIAIRKVVQRFITGFGAAFGDMYAKNEIALMKKNLCYYERILFSITTIVYSCCLVLIVSFIRIYTMGVNDANYIQPIFAIILTVASAFSCFRIPYQTIVTAIGHYKQTRNGSFIEAILNIGISLALVFKFGLVGIAIGTLVAAIFRTFNFGIYLSKCVLDRSSLIIIKNIVFSLASLAVIYFIDFLINPNLTNYFEWFIYALIIGCSSCVVVFTFNIILFKNDTLELFKKIKNMIVKRNKSNNRF